MPRAYCHGGPWEGRIVEIAPGCREFLAKAPRGYVRYHKLAPKDRPFDLVTPARVAVWAPAPAFRAQVDDHVRVVATGKVGHVSYFDGDLVAIRFERTDGWPFPRLQLMHRDAVAAA